ncbi:MAG: HD domain-containing phosphohydrolase [Legionella sp.]|jgi:HD-GYP domain-containing protein (c-di-GMP phosphodiesterase class II)
MRLNKKHFASLLKTLADIGVALSAEKNPTRLLESILLQAKKITNADGGTLYSCQEGTELKFEIMLNTSMGLQYGGTSGQPSKFNNLPLYDAKGRPNKHMLAPYAAISQKTINIKNAYTNKQFDLSGTKAFDQMTGYHSQSFLTVPMTNHLNEVIGVLQLINALDKKTNEVIAFSALDQLLAESLASQAAIIVTNTQLIGAQKQLFDSLIQLIAQAIDEKSPYTGGHCRRVPVITKMIAEATCTIDKGPLKDFHLTEDELYELEVAAWLHDCGKITTPEAVVDKATKLEEIIDGIHLIDTRFEVLKRDATIESLQEQNKKNTGTDYKLENDKKLQAYINKLDKERDFLRKCNIGGEKMQPEDIEAIHKIAQYRWLTPNGQEEPFLSDEEVSLLDISRGTLSGKERNIINRHVSMTIKMLKSLPYPKNLKNVPELAGCHHEKMDGSGYPRGLVKEQMSIPARMIAIADVFEALTSNDRPYKKAMHLSQALSILGQMKLDGHIDPDLFDVFMHYKIYQQYADQYLNKEVFDLVDVTTIPGYKSL